jgi:SAM-dependent methyltransferase
MPANDEIDAKPEAAFYGPQYARIDSRLAAEIRREAFGEDIGQESWRSAAEQGEIAGLLGLTAESRVLDVACGAGGPSLALVERFGCSLTGLDIEPEGVAHGNAAAKKRGLAERASFVALDCGGVLPFEHESFDAILCIDAICHLPDRRAALSEWRRLLRTGGRLIFTDPFVVTGPIAKGEIDGRSALGSNLFFVPPGYNEESLTAARLALLSSRDCAAAVAKIASRWRDARERRAEILRREEGDDWFDRRQRMLGATAALAKERRLSRFLYLAEKRARAV